MIQPDIQSRLTEINLKISNAQAERDRQFWSLIAYIWIVAIGICIAAFSVPRAAEGFHQRQLFAQESIHHG